MGITKGEDLLPYIGQLENAGKDPNLINSSDPALKNQPDKWGRGLYQINNETADTYGLDRSKLLNADYNTQGAKTILNDLYTKAGGDIRRTVASYNAGPNGAVKQMKDKGDTVLPAQTQAYLKKFDAIYKPGDEQALPPVPPQKPTPVAAQAETTAPAPPQVPIDMESQLGSFGVHGKMLLEDGWFAQKAALLRSKGATWDQVHNLMNEQWEELRAKGGTDEQIERIMGFANPQPIDSRIRDHVSTALAALPPPLKANTMWGAMLAGSQNSVVGMLSDKLQGEGAMPTVELADDATRAQRIAYGVFQGIGDYPAMFAGFLGTRSMAGAAALPTAIKAAIADGYANGMFRDSSDAASRIGHIAWETAKSAAEAKAFGMVGGRAASLTTKFALQKFGQKMLTEEGAKWAVRGVKAASGAAYWAGGLSGQTAAQAVLEQHIPSMNDVIDNGIQMLLLHGVTSLDKLPAVKKNIMDRWATTNARPADTLAEAQKDPSLYTDMVTDPNSKVPPGSMIAETGEGQHVVARERGAFDDAMKTELQRNEAGVRYGIDSKHFPDVDLSTLTPEAAADMLHDKVWKGLNLKSYPQDVAQDIFRYGAREGVEKARELLDIIDKLPETLKEQMNPESDTAAAPMNHPDTMQEALKDSPEWIKLQEQFHKAGLGELSSLVSRVNDGMEFHFGQHLAKMSPAAEPEVPKGARKMTPEELAAVEAKKADLNRMPFNRRPANAKPEPGRSPPLDGLGVVWADPAAKVREGMADGNGKKTFSEAWYQQAYRELWNSRSPIHRIYDAIHQGQPFDPNDPTLMHLRDEEMSHARSMALFNRQLKPILDTIKPGEKADFETYLTAYRAKAEHEWGVKNAVDVDAARQMVENAPAHFKTALDGIIKFRGGLMDYMRDRGMFSDSDIERYAKERDYGIPGWRERELPGVRAPKGSRIWNPVRFVRGGGEKFVSPYEALVADTFTRISLADRNATINALAPRAVEAGLATTEVVTRKADKTTPGIAETDTNTAMGEGSAKALQKMAGRKLEDDEVAHFVNGELHITKFADPEVTAVLRHYDDKGMSFIMKAITAPSRWTREFIVRNPLFAPTIGTMDQFYQGTFGKGFTGEQGALANFGVGLWHTMLRTERFKQAVDAGIVSHYYESLSRDEMVKAALRGQAPQGFLGRTWNGVHAASEWWNQSWLNGPSVGSYIRAIDRGDDPLVARANASEAVFHRAAFGGQVSRGINSAVPFFSAHLNGLEKTFKALAGGKNELGQSYNVKAAWTKAVGLITLPMLYSWYANKDKDWYKAMHDYEKDNYLPLRIGGDGPEGFTYKFRLPPMVGTIFGGLPRRLAQMMVDHDPHAGEDIGATLAESFKPPGMETFGPSWVTPLLENYANKNFQTGRPIVSDREREQLLPYAQFKPYTTETAKFIGDALGHTPLTRGGGYSPDKIDHLIKGWTGNAGMSLLQTIEHLAGAKASGPKFNWMDLPEFNSLIARYPSAGAEPISKYHERMDTYNQVHGTLLDAMKRNDLAGFKEVLADHPEMSAMHRWQLGKGELASMAQSNIDPAPFADALSKITHTKMDEDTAARVVQGQKLMQNWNMVANATRSSTTLKPEEKSQLLEMTYLNLQRTAETITKQMDKAGWK